MQRSMVLYDPSRDVEAQRGEIERAIGPTAAASIDGEECRRGRHRGHEVFAAVGVSEDGDLSRVDLRASLGGRPIRLEVHRAVLLTPRDYPIVATDDPAFDAAVVTWGGPATVLREVLDARTRAWVLDPAHGMAITASAGWVALDARLTTVRGPLSFDRGRVMPAEELRAVIDTLLDVRDRLVGGFDRQYGEIARAHGDARAAEWATEHVRHYAAGARNRRRVGAMILVGCAAACVVPFVAAAVWWLL